MQICILHYEHKPIQIGSNSSWKYSTIDGPQRELSCARNRFRLSGITNIRQRHIQASIKIGHATDKVQISHHVGISSLLKKASHRAAPPITKLRHIASLMEATDFERGTSRILVAVRIRPDKKPGNHSLAENQDKNNRYGAMYQKSIVRKLDAQVRQIKQLKMTESSDRCNHSIQIDDNRRLTSQSHNQPVCNSH